MRLILILLITMSLTVPSYSSDARSPAALHPARPVTCPESASNCADRDAIVFVHGIYGDRETFVNSKTQFSWPEELPHKFRGRTVDVYILNYQTELLSWAQGKNIKFKELNTAVYDALKPLRKRGYRSIGFIAHSLGGNVISSYIHFVKSSRNHPSSSQHAYVITLATPVLGSQVADIGSSLKSLLGMTDPLLDTLKKNNTFLEMLLEFRRAEGPKRELYGCRPINLHAAYEEKYLGPFLVVTRESAEESIAQLTASPIVGFRLDHSEIVKPSDANHEVFKWVNYRIDEEFVRLSAWSKAVERQPIDRRLCIDIPFKPETE